MPCGIIANVNEEKFMPFKDVSGWELLIIALVYIAIPIGIIWAMVQWVQFFKRKNGGNALDSARERYAKGEISKAEFDEIKKNII